MNWSSPVHQCTHLYKLLHTSESLIAINLSSLHTCHLYIPVIFTHLSHLHTCHLYTPVTFTYLSPLHTCHLYTPVTFTHLSPLHTCTHGYVHSPVSCHSKNVAQRWRQPPATSFHWSTQGYSLSVTLSLSLSLSLTYPMSQSCVDVTIFHFDVTDADQRHVGLV